MRSVGKGSGRRPSSASIQPFLPTPIEGLVEPEAAQKSPPDLVFFPESVAATAALTESKSSNETDDVKSIWQTSLADLPPEQAHEIHTLRTRLGSIAAQSLGLSSLEPLETEPQLIDIPKDGSMKRADSRRTVTEAEVKSAIAQVVAESRDQHEVIAKIKWVESRNYEQNALPGFKRTELFVAHHDGANGESRDLEASLLIWSERLDLSPGRIRPTGNPFDIAIEGPGWLCVESSEKLLLTRNGQLAVSTARRLAVRTPRGVLAVVPPIEVPANAGRVEIWPDGRCIAWIQTSEINGAASQHECGQLLIANCLDAAQLKPMGDGLYGATETSGEIWKAEPGKHGLGKLRAQALEESNAVAKPPSH